jgi:hypothetical protein
MKKIILLLILSATTFFSQAQDATIFKVIRASYNEYNHTTQDWIEKKANDEPDNIYLIIRGDEVKLSVENGLRLMLTSKGERQVTDDYRSIDYSAIDRDGYICRFSLVFYKNGGIGALVFYYEKKPWSNLSYRLIRSS